MKRAELEQNQLRADSPSRDLGLVPPRLEQQDSEFLPWGREEGKVCAR